MPERDQTRPLAISSPSSNHLGGPDPEYDGAAAAKKRLRRRRCLQCCGCASTVLVLLAITIIVLVFTVFRVRDPTINMDSIQIERLDFNPDVLRPSLNLTLAAALSIKNPNYASLKFTNTTTMISYGGSIVGEARTPPGNAKARKTMKLNVTVDVIPGRIVAVQGLARDLISRSLTVTSVTKIAGRVKIIGIKKHVDVRMDCAITVNLTDRSVQKLDCDRHVSL